jgi:hypothetical protein
MAVFAGTVDAPDVVGFLLSCIFEFHQVPRAAAL